MKLKPLLARAAQAASRAIHHDLTLIALVMLGARVLAIVALRPGGYVAETGPDSAYHFQLGRLAASGAYPFVDYWVEYPPFFPWLAVLAHRVSSLLPSWIDQRLWFNFVLHALIVPFDVLNLILIYALSRRVNGIAWALKSAWLYAILFVPLFVTLGWFETVALAAVLLALWAVVADRAVLAGAAIGLGLLVKPTIALIAPVGLIFLSTWKRVGKMFLAASLALLAGIAPLALTNLAMLRAHVDTLLTLPGWSSPWALIDGVIKHTDPNLADRFDPALAASPIAGGQVPWAAVTLAFGAAYVVLLVRAYRHQHVRATVAFAGVTFVMYLLWSKGYSPQWSLYLLAFLCVLMPNLRGVLMMLILEALYVIEWPIAFILLRADPGYLTALVAVRTLALIGLGLLFGALVFVEGEPGWSRLRKASLAGSLAGLAAVAGLVFAGLPLYAAQRYQADPMRQAVELIQSASSPQSAGVLFDRVDSYERLAPFLPGWPMQAALRLGGAADAWSDAQLEQFAHERPEVWYVLDFGNPTFVEAGQQIDRRLGQSLCAVTKQFAGNAQVTRYTTAEPVHDMDAAAQFDDGIRLEGARASGEAARPGEAMCVELAWSAGQSPSTDYTVFVHLLDAGGRLVAQSDVAPASGYAPTSQWPAGQTIIDRHGLIVPADAAPGTYRLAVGMYDRDGKRLRVGESDTFTLGTVEVAP